MTKSTVLDEHKRDTFTRHGVVIIYPDGSIVSDGFAWDPEHRDGLPSCRDHKRAVMVWALEQITRELVADSAHDHENYRACVDINSAYDEAEKIAKVLEEDDD